MKSLIFSTLMVAFATVSVTLAAETQTKEPIRVGVIYDFTGPFAAGGSEAGAVGTRIAIDLINEQGGVAGHPVEAIFADAQSRVEVAISEAERLWAQNDVDILMGIYSSAHCVPLAQRADSQRRFLWINICSASSMLRDKRLEYVFRVQVHSDQFGEASVRFLAENADASFGVAPGDLRLAIVYEDSPYGAGVAAGNALWAEHFGMTVALKEGYAASAPDLSALVTKLRRARPDVILHTGYNPDITLFLRQAREMGLRFKALIGHAGGYSELEKLRATFGDDVSGFFNVSPAAAELLDPVSLRAGLGEVIQEMVARYRLERGPGQLSAHVSSGFNATWILLREVVPLAIARYGGFDADALRQAALDADLPEGATVQGYGVRFHPPEHAMAGQNMRSFPVIVQYVGDTATVVWPAPIATAAPLLPLPATSPYAERD